MATTDPAAITAARLQLFAPRSDYLILAPALDREAKRCEINTIARVTHFLAQLHHESAGFTRLLENLNYTAVRLTQVWPTRFPTVAAAMPYANNPEALANKTYGGRMGNTAPGDGWKYRGRGLIQLTGKDAYAKASEWTGLDLVATPEMAGVPQHAARIAADFWAEKGLNELADTGDIRAITLKINGGLNGLEERDRLRRFALTIWRA